MQYLARSATDLSNALRGERKQRGLTQAQLASLAGVWPRTISQIETGNGDARVETLFSLLAALDLELQIVPRRRVEAADLEDLF